MKPPIDVRQTGLNSEFTFPSEVGFEVSIAFQSPLENPGLFFEIHSVEKWWLTRIDYLGRFYRAVWGYKPDHEMGILRSTGDEKTRFRTLSITYLSHIIPVVDQPPITGTPEVLQCPPRTGA